MFFGPCLNATSSERPSLITPCKIAVPPSWPASPLASLHVSYSSYHHGLIIYLYVQCNLHGSRVFVPPAPRIVPGLSRCSIHVCWRDIEWMKKDPMKVVERKFSAQEKGDDASILQEWREKERYECRWVYRFGVGSWGCSFLPASCFL